MLPFLIDFAFSLIFHFLLVSVVVGIFLLITKKSIAGFPLLKVCGIAVAWAAFVTFGSSSHNAESKTNETANEGIRKDTLSISEQNELARIYKKVAPTSDTLDEGSHASFWAIVKRHGGNPEKIDGIPNKAAFYA